MASLQQQKNGKFGPKYYGPFKVLDRIDDVTYKLDLSSGARLHDAFHIGLLKKYHGDNPMGPGVLPLVRHGCACPVPAAVLKGRLARGVHELLVHWEGQPAAEATWMPLGEFQRLLL